MPNEPTNTPNPGTTTTPAQGTSPAVPDAGKTPTPAAAPDMGIERSDEVIVDKKPTKVEPKVEAKTETPPADPQKKDGDKTPAKDPEKTETQTTGETKLTKEDLKLPDGSKLAAAHVDEILAFANENKLSKETATKILEREDSLIQNARKAGAEEFQSTQTARTEAVGDEWFHQAKSDPEFGGDRFEGNCEKVFRLVDYAFGADGKRLLDQTKLGNNLGVLKGLLKLADLHGNDSLVTGQQSGKAKPVLSDKEAIYPEMMQQQ